MSLYNPFKVICKKHNVECDEIEGGYPPLDLSGYSCPEGKEEDDVDDPCYITIVPAEDWSIDIFELINNALKAKEK